MGKKEADKMKVIINKASLKVIVDLKKEIESLKNCCNCGRATFINSNEFICEVKQFCYRGCFGDLPDEWIGKEIKK